MASIAMRVSYGFLAENGLNTSAETVVKERTGMAVYEHYKNWPKNGASKDPGTRKDD